MTVRPLASIRPSRRVAALAAAAVLGALTVGTAVGQQAAALPSAAELGPGCDPQRAAVVHGPGGVAAEDAGVVRVPCATETGYYTGETTISVTADNTVYFSAANWEWALARTKDEGRSWEDYTVPGPQAFPGCSGGTSAAQTCSDSESAKNNTVADAFVFTDPYAGRTFWSKTFGYAVCSSLNYSDDGKRWTPNTQFGCPGGDYEKIAAGPPPAGGAKPVGYASVVYGCTNGPAPTFVVGPARVCYKSLDGGKSFSLAGAPVVPSPQAPGCLHFQEQPVVGPDGTIFQPLGCSPVGRNSTGVDVRVAYSTDEAQTWSYLAVPTGTTGNGSGLIGGVTAGVDKNGTLYVLWTGTDRKAYLAVTKNRGATWTGPFDVTLPGVTVDNPLAQLAADVKRPGHIAVAYYGHTGTQIARHNGYLMESSNADSATPVFHTAQLNKSDAPLYFTTETGSLPRNDYLGVTIAPDGTPWTALVKLRSPKPSAEGFIQSTGFAGRLVTARRA